jgi:NADH-quinone oxidoreductase subunit E
MRAAEAGMEVRFSEAALREVERLVSLYPSKRAAILPVLWLAQKEFGYLSTEVQRYVAELLGFPLAWIAGLASFYTMLYKKPVGRFHLQVCTNISCTLRGADEIVRCLERRLGVGLGETTPDGRFTLDEVECLASCGTAPAMQVNDEYYEHLDPEKVLELVDRLARE